MGTDDHHRSFDRLLRPHLDRLYRLALRLAGSKPEAEDLFQDVLVKLYPRMDELIELDEPGPWLARVLYNQFIDEQRRYRRRRLIAVNEGELPDNAGVESFAGDLDTVADAARRDDIMRLHHALGALSDEHRLVVLLHDVEGYKLAEIQLLTDTPVGTLKSRLHRARARLREILDADGTVSPREACLEAKRNNA